MNGARVRVAGARIGIALALLSAVPMALGATATPQKPTVDRTGGSGLRYDNQREVAIPDYATIRIGPFYSTVVLNMAAGYRWTRSSGAGTDYYYESGRGRILKDGSEIPMYVGLDFRNYVPITRHSDLDVSVRTLYSYFPLGTEENMFTVSLPGQQIGSSLSWGYRLTPYLVGSIYDRFTYGTEYLDSRGRRDEFGGRKLTSFNNRVGGDLSWLLSRDSDLVLDASRGDYIVINNKEEFGDQEHVEYVEGVTYERRFFERIVLGARLGLTERYYKVDTRPDTVQQDFNVFARGTESGSQGIPITDHTTLTLSLGASTGKSKGQVRDQNGTVTDTNTDTASALSATAALRTQISRYLSHEISYTRGLRSSYNTSFEAYDQWGYQLNYDRPGVGLRFYSTYAKVQPERNLSAASVTNEFGELVRPAYEQPYDTWTTGVGLNVPLTKILTLEASYNYIIQKSGGSGGYAVDDVNNPEYSNDYYDRQARIGTALKIMKEVTFRTYVERYQRLSDLDTLEFTRDTFEAILAYSHEF